MYDELYVADGYTFYKIIEGMSNSKNSAFILLNKKDNYIDIRLSNSDRTIVSNLKLTNCKVKENKNYKIYLKKLANITKVKSSNNKEFEFSFGKDLILSKVVKEYDLIRSRVDKTLNYEKAKEEDLLTLEMLHRIDYGVNLVMDKWLLTDFFDEFKFSGVGWDNFVYYEVEMQSFGEEMFFISSHIEDSSANFVIKKGQVDKLTSKNGEDQVCSFSLHNMALLRDIKPAIKNHKIEFYLKSNHPFYIKINFPSINGLFEMWIAPSTNKGYYNEIKIEDEIKYVEVDEKDAI